MMSLPMNLVKSCIRFLAGSDLAPSAPALRGGGFWLSALSPSGLGAFCFSASTRTGVSSGRWSGRLAPDSPVGTAAAAGLARNPARRCSFLLEFGLDPGLNPGVFGKLLDFFPDFSFFWLILSERARKVKFFRLFLGFFLVLGSRVPTLFLPLRDTRARVCVCTCIGAYVGASGRTHLGVSGVESVRVMGWLAGRKKSFR